jgi:hypothetical protein
VRETQPPPVDVPVPPPLDVAVPEVVLLSPPLDVPVPGDDTDGVIGRVVALPEPCDAPLGTVGLEEATFGLDGGAGTVVGARTGDATWGREGVLGWAAGAALEVTGTGGLPDLVGAGGATVFVGALRSGAAGVAVSCSTAG